MKFEHFALNVPDVHGHVDWYLKNLGLTVARRLDNAPYMTFLADDTGRVIIELYSNPKAAYPDYAAAHPLLLHIAFVTSDARTERDRLERAGAKFFAEDVLPDGTILLMLRDPWGVPLQFCQRAKPFPMPA